MNLANLLREMNDNHKSWKLEKICRITKYQLKVFNQQLGMKVWIYPSGCFYRCRVGRAKWHYGLTMSDAINQALNNELFEG